MRIRIPALLVLIAPLVLPTAACAETFRVASATAAQSAIDRAKPGDEIVLADGIHADFRVALRGKGTAKSPIILRGATPGKVILTGKVSIRIQGEGLVVRDLVFDQAWGGTVVVFDGATSCLLSDCAFVECGNPRSTATHIVTFRNHSHHNAVERCLMQGNLSMGVGVSISRNNFSNTHNRISWNYFKDIKRRSGNGQEAVQLGQSTPADRTAQHTVVEHNLFERANGDAEIISNKSSYNILRHNTVRDCSAMLVLRRGYHTRVEGNYFFGGAGGIRAYGGFHQILNNYIEGGNVGIYIPSGALWNTGALGYPPFTRGVVAYNTIVNCRTTGIHVGQPNTHPMTTVRLPLIENDFIGNLVVGREGELIRDDGSINSTWRGNLVHATGTAKPGYQNAGIQIADPKLEQRDGIWRLPVTGSPAINPPSVNYHDVNAPPPGAATDIDGQARDGKPDTGCDEVAAGPVRYPPLQPKDVGPGWMAGDPSRLGRIPAPKPIPKMRKRRRIARRGKVPHPVPVAVSDDGAERTVQAEDFLLFAGAEVRQIKGVAGTGAVLLAGIDSQAEASVSLPPGTYQIELHTRSDGEAHDAIIVVLAGKALRSYRAGAGFGPTGKALVVTIAKGGPQDLIIKAGETGVLADQVVIRRVGQ